MKRESEPTGVHQEYSEPLNKVLNLTAVLGFPPRDATEPAPSCHRKWRGGQDVERRRGEKTWGDRLLFHQGEGFEDKGLGDRIPPLWGQGGLDLKRFFCHYGIVKETKCLKMPKMELVLDHCK